MMLPFFSFLTAVLGRDSEGELIDRLKQRDTHAMADLYDRFKRLVYSIIYQAVRDQGIAEDLTQETFWRVWNRIQTFDADKGKLSPWIATIARNRAVDYLRSARGAQQYSFESLETSSNFVFTESPASQVEKERLVLHALKQLNPAQREVIELTHYQGLTQTEIAAQLQRPLGTVKGILRSALKTLRANMQGVEA